MYARPKFHGSSSYSFRENDLNIEKFTPPPPTTTTTTPEKLYICLRRRDKNGNTLNNYRVCPTSGTVGFYSAIQCSKDADKITNRVDPDQTAP